MGLVDVDGMCGRVSVLVALIGELGGPSGNDDRICSHVILVAA